MERFYFEIPSMEREKDAIEFIQEFYEYQSETHGVGGLSHYLDNYGEWLEKLENDYCTVPSEERVPARTYFFVRESDHKIIGMSNIRLALNNSLREYGGHIGYSIRPTERGKGYNNIHLYLGLKVCDEHEIDEVFMDADLNNPASWKTMEHFGGKRKREYYHEGDKNVIVDYYIDVKEALANHSEYEKMLVQGGKIR